MNYLIKVLFFIICLYTQDGFSFDPVIMNCKETPEIYDIESKPNHFIKSNNLRRKVGSPISAKGKLIYIIGRVTDIDCLPIKNANVFIWHTNSNGHYQTDNKISHQEDLTYDIHFNGSGTSVTDNLGNYSFITIMPGGYSDRIPHVNFIVQHPDFLELTTSMFFPENNNSNDPKFKSALHKDLANLLIPFYNTNENGISIYKFDITLGSKNIYEKKIL